MSDAALTNITKTAANIIKTFGSISAPSIFISAELPKIPADDIGIVILSDFAI